MGVLVRCVGGVGGGGCGCVGGGVGGGCGFVCAGGGWGGGCGGAKKNPTKPVATNDENVERGESPQKI